LLLEAGADVTLRNFAGCTALHSAAVGFDRFRLTTEEAYIYWNGVYERYPEIVRSVLRHSNDTDRETRLAPPSPPHSDAAESTDEAVLSNTSNEFWNHVAQLGRVIYLLLQAKADIHAQTDPEKLTPLHIAAKSRFPEAVLALLIAGADPTIRDVEGHIPLDLAVGENHAGVVLILLEATDLDLTIARGYLIAGSLDGRG
jgi:ankyrin repeat protein